MPATSIALVVTEPVLEDVLEVAIFIFKSNDAVNNEQESCQPLGRHEFTLFDLLMHYLFAQTFRQFSTTPLKVVV